MLEDFVNAIIDFIEANITDIPTITMDKIPFSDVTTGLTFRLVSSPIHASFLDNNYDYNIAFQLIYKNTDTPLKILDKLGEITFLINEMTNNDISTDDNSFCFIKGTVTNMPAFIEKTAKEEYIYSALYNAVVQKN